MGAFLSQSFFLPNATITERNCPDQKDRVIIVTGGYAGVGLELVKILVACNATVYIAGRDEAKAAKAVAAVKDAHPSTTGRVEFLRLDLADLSTIKPAVEKFKSLEKRLDALVNNAGVMFPPAGSITAQSHDLQIGTNCLGHYLLYKLLDPLLESTALIAPTASVRVLWAASIGIEVASPKPGGMKLKADGCPEDLGPEVNYAQTKTGNYFFARHFAQADSSSSVIHLAFNPGNLRTELQRHWKGIGHTIVDNVLLFPSIHGAHTELWAATTPEITPRENGSYVWPWGRIGSIRRDVKEATTPQADGGTGLAERFVAWCDEQITSFT